MSYGPSYGVVRVTLQPGRRAISVDAVPELPHLSIYSNSVDPQWIYFDRNFHVERLDERFIFKPLQSFWWTRSQAIVDADQIATTALQENFATNGSSISKA